MNELLPEEELLIHPGQLGRNRSLGVDDSDSFRSLRGDSIRSLRELLEFSLSSSSSLLPGGENADEEAIETNQEQEIEADDEKRRDEIASKQQQERQQPQASSGRDADEVRTRLLRNLGIQKQQRVTTGTAGGSDLAMANPPPSVSESSWGPSYTVLLNDDAINSINTYETATSASCEKEGARIQKSSTTTTSDKETTLRFDPAVTVHPIPSHKAYSNRIKETIWTGRDELSENVARNSLEFAYEEWDANQVLDENTGLIHTNQGEWVHPVHFGLMPEDTSLSSDEIWKQACERLGIQPAEYYHSLPTTSTTSSSSPKQKPTR